MVIAFNSTGIARSTIQSNAPMPGATQWAPVSLASTTYLVFYSVLPEIASTATATANVNLNINIDTGSLASGTKLAVAVWMTDGQIPTDTAQAISDAAPTAVNPPIAAYGIAATVYSAGFTFTTLPTSYITYAQFTSV
jgi:hypothetical protein